MAITIDQLQVEIQARSTSAASSIDALSTSLGKLRTAVKGGVGLTTTTKQLQAFSQAVQTMQAPTQKIAELVAALKPLETIGKSNLGSTLNQLKKIPEITAGLDDAKLSAFAAKITQVTAAVRPLAVEMEKVSAGFSRLPANIQRAINANARLTKSNRSTSFSFNMMAAKIAIVYSSLRRVANIVGGWIKESNDYVENLNLFTVAMGKYAESAKKYAEQVQEAVGIDASEFMRYQGVFMNMARGFGVAADNAALMSKNLTQLGYDLASLYNVKFDTAMEKLESALSGQPRPMREWGFDLSEATLKAKALELGIKKNVELMSQAEKSQIRYVQLLDTARKIGATGDFARTLNTSANQLRILQAQATLAARALGNIFIPALNAVLPYAIAFLKVIRFVAQEIANLFGFSLPEIDYSGIDAVIDAGEAAEGALDGATGAAKKLKGMLAGFDELNIIASENAGGGGGSGGGGVGGGGDLGIKLPEYDFLGSAIETKVDNIMKKLKNAIKWIKENIDIIWDVIKSIGIALLSWKIASGVLDFFSKMGLLGGLNATKLAFGITLMITGFALEFSGAKAIGYGNADLWDYIKTVLGGALGIAGSLLVFGSGPLGWTIGIVAAITVAIAGITVGANEKLSDLVEDWFYSYGEWEVTITSLADAYGRMADEIVARKQPIIDGFAAYEQGKESVAKTSQELDALLLSVQYNTDSIKTKLPEIKTAFEQLLSDTQGTLASLRDTILLSLAGATGEAYVAMGGDLAGIYALLDETFGAADRVLKDSQERLGELYAQLESGDGSSDAIIAEILELKGTISSLTQDSIPEVENFQLAANTAFNGVNFENPEAVSEALGKFKEKTDAATDAINQGAAAELGAINELERLAGVLGIELSPETQSLLAQYKAQIETTRENDIKAINTQFETAASAIGTGLVTAMQGVTEEASAKWNNMNPLEKWFAGGNEAAYVEKALTNYRNTIVNPVQQKLIEANGAIGTDVAGQTDSIMDDVMASLFEYSANGMGFYVSGFKTDVESAFKGPLEELGKSIPSGIAKGVNANTSDITNATEGAAKKGIDAFASAQQSRSPARKYIEQGLYAMQGFANGVKNNVNIAVTAVKNAVDSILKPLKEVVDAGREIGVKTIDALASGFENGMRTHSGTFSLLSSEIENPLSDAERGMFSTGERIVDNLTRGVQNATPSLRWAFESMFNNVRIKLPHFSITGRFDVDPPRVPSVKVSWYASGGFPVPGELFVARESGPEMVGTMGGRTAVANNDQIVEGVASGVSAANAEQNALLREQNRILVRLLEKEGTVVFPTSVEAGRAVHRAISMYDVARGAT